MMEITIRVPDKLGHQLQQYHDRLPEVLERVVQELAAEGAPPYQDEGGVIALLASRPEPEQVLALRPSAELQERIDDLLDRSKQGTLMPAEEAELDRYQLVEHLVRLAKAQAMKQLMKRA